MNAVTHPLVAPSTPTQARRELVASVAAGQIAGLIMAVVMMAVFTLLLGKGPLFPVQVIGSLIVGEPALHGFNLTAVVAGLLLHQLGASLVWGLIFGGARHLLRLEGAGQLAALGVAVGLASQILDIDLLMPRVMTALHGRDLWAAGVPVSWSWAAHLVFGLALGLSFPIVQRKLEGRLVPDHR